MTAQYQLLAEDDDARLISQMQNGSLALSSDGNAAIFSANGENGVVGKSALSTQITPISIEDPKTVVVNFSFMIPDGGQLSSIMIADLESSSSNIGTNPGMRINMQDGFLRVDRSKLGIEEPWYTDQTEAIQTGQWNDIEIRMVPGLGQDGVFEIYLNSELILSEHGDNILSSEVMAQFGIDAPDTQLDRIQVGLTANSNEEATSIAIRDLEISVDGETVLDNIEPALNVAEAIYEAGTENDPVVVDYSPDGSFFGQTLVGTTGADSLNGDMWDDTISGGAGDDVLFGGAGSDVLNGGAGSDFFIFRPGMGNDVVEDFTSGVDVLVFDVSGQDTASSEGNASGGNSAPVAFDASEVSGIDTSDGLVIHYRGDTFLIEDMTINDFSPADFMLI